MSRQQKLHNFLVMWVVLCSLIPASGALGEVKASLYVRLGLGFEITKPGLLGKPLRTKSGDLEILSRPPASCFKGDGVTSFLDREQVTDPEDLTKGLFFALFRNYNLPTACGSEEFNAVSVLEASSDGDVWHIWSNPTDKYLNELYYRFLEESFREKPGYVSRRDDGLTSIHLTSSTKENLKVGVRNGQFGLGIAEEKPVATRIFRAVVSAQRGATFQNNGERIGIAFDSEISPVDLRKQMDLAWQRSLKAYLDHNRITIDLIEQGFTEDLGEDWREKMARRILQR